MPNRCKAGLFLEAARCRACASRTARDVSFSTLWAVIDRLYSLSAACAEAIDETAGSLFNRGHGIEDHVLAETACHKLNAGRQIFDEVYRHNTGRQPEIVHAVTVDRCIEQVFRLHPSLCVIVPWIGRPHEEGRQHERIGIEEHVPRAHHPRSVGKPQAIAIKIENRSEFVVPGKDLAHLVGSKLLDGWTKRRLELREQHSEPAARRLHDGWRFSLDHLISRVAQISRSPVDYPANAGVDWISVTVACDRNADRFRQRLAVEWHGYPQWIARIAGRHDARCETHIFHGTGNRPLYRRELGKKAALDGGRRIERRDPARRGLERCDAVGESREPQRATDIIAVMDRAEARGCGGSGTA